MSTNPSAENQPGDGGRQFMVIAFLLGVAAAALLLVALTLWGRDVLQSEDRPIQIRQKADPSVVTIITPTPCPPADADAPRPTPEPVQLPGVLYPDQGTGGPITAEGEEPPSTPTFMYIVLVTPQPIVRNCNPEESLQREEADLDPQP